MTGTGTESDPYIINSTEDFLFMSKQTLSSKYIELACDIDLNDETFDENGQASGGDGNVYTWEPITTWAFASFNGNGYIISGLYHNNKNTQSFALLNCNLKSIQNLKMSNVFIIAESASALSCFSATEIKNVETLSGNIYGIKLVSGLCKEVTRIFDCINRINIYQIETSAVSVGFAGISCGVNGCSIIKNCKNYGNIESSYASGGEIVGCFRRTGNCIELDNVINYGKIKNNNNAFMKVGGLFSIAGVTTISNCSNYGEIFNINGYSGGIVAEAVAGGRTSFIKCCNYGSLTRVGGSIVGYGDKVCLSECKNFGKIIDGAGFISITAGEFCEVTKCTNYGDFKLVESKQSGLIARQATAKKVNISDCKFYGSISGIAGNYGGVIGYVTSKDYDISIKNVVIDMDFDIASDLNVFGYSYSDAYGSINVSNVIIKTNNVNLRLIRNFSNENMQVNIKDVIVENTAKSSNFKIIGDGKVQNLYVKNLLVQEICKYELSNPSFFISTSNEEVDGVIIKEITQGKVLGYYFGSDDKNSFKNFFVKWNTGRIGLSTMEAVGSFYGSVDEGVLDYYNYKKVEIA